MPRRLSVGVARLLPTIELLLALVAGAVAYFGGGAVWHSGQNLGIWPIALILPLWPLYWLAQGLALRPTWLDLALVLFLASAAVGVFTAYARGPAWAKFCLIASAVGICYAIAHQPSIRHVRVALGGIGLVAAAIALYFIASNDWAGAPSKVALLTRVGVRASGLLPALHTHKITPNVAGGMLATLLPLYVPLVVGTTTEKSLDTRTGAGPSRVSAVSRRALWWVCGALSLAGCLLSSSRGAWLGIACAAALWLAWRATGSWQGRGGDGRHSWRARIWAMLLLMTFMAVGAVAAAYAIGSQNLPGAVALRNRWALVRDSMTLARDYALSGAGLGVFQMHFSIYALLIEIGYIVNSHNMPIDLLIEQGAVGLVAFVAAVALCMASALRALKGYRGSATLVIEAAVASLMVSLLHGLVDDVLYGSRGVLLLFVPFGLVIACTKKEGQRPPIAAADESSSADPKRRRVSMFVLLPIVISAGIINGRMLASAWFANLGAVHQARAELARYVPKRARQLSLDLVRQQSDLDPAIVLFERALEASPRNRTAIQRLAAIELSRLRHGRARTLMEQAWGAGYRDSVTRLLFADALIADGEVERAVSLVQGLPWAIPRLRAQISTRHRPNGILEQELFTWQAVLLLDPDIKLAQQEIATISRRLAESQR